MTISNLGDDLLVEILILSFPNPRSACRSKSVCKRWKTVISSPRFNRRFVSHHQSINEPKPPILLASNDPESVIRGFLPTPAPSANRLGRPRHFMVFDSLDDLLLCGFAEAGEILSHDEIFRSYLLCNPFTKQWVALPLAPERPAGYKSLVPSLVCDSNINLDLGDGQAFAHSSDYRFRVVCMYQHSNSTKLDVFCSEIGEWMKEALRWRLTINQLNSKLRRSFQSSTAKGIRDSIDLVRRGWKLSIPVKNPETKLDPIAVIGKHCSSKGEESCCPGNGCGCQAVRLNVGDRATIDREIRRAAAGVGVYVDEHTGNQYVRMNGDRGRPHGDQPTVPLAQASVVDLHGSQPPPTQP
ncbi:unnamed protein product [Linum tenue]|uniref:F-box domain-containing protein n=1 Tax=Linum tenue TaxID=586396 RepID=A0AAV0R8I0_9ROSI|nr:unnamed protein product [Linum tenue]